MAQSQNWIEFVVSHFIRINIESKYPEINIPTEIKKLIEEFAQKSIGCSLLTDEEEFAFIELLSSTKLPNIKKKEFKLLYKASDNEYSASIFHKLCDNQGATLTIIESEYGNIFGGYTSVSWSSGMGDYVADRNAFLFTIRIPTSDNPTIINPKYNEGGTVVHNKKFGPVFGSGHDIKISDKCNNSFIKDIAAMNLDIDASSYTSGCSYNHDGTICGKDAPEHYGGHFFNVKDYEVFVVTDSV